MKKITICLFAAIASIAWGEDQARAIAETDIFATGADIQTIRIGTAGAAIQALPISVEDCTIIPWQISVTNAVKSSTQTNVETIYTNYVCSATITNSMQTPVFDVNGAVAGMTNLVSVQTITNNFSQLPGAPWTMVSRAGYPVTNTTPTKVAAGGSIRLYSTEGMDWGSFNLTNGAFSRSDILVMTKFGFRGTLRVTATEAEEAELRLTYLKLK